MLPGVRSKRTRLRFLAASYWMRSGLGPEVNQPGRCRVYIQQTVLPHYRVPLFEALTRQPGLHIQVHTSRSYPGAPDSVANVPRWADCDHALLRFLGNRLFWQPGLRLPSGYGAGDVLVVNGNPRLLSNFHLIAEARRRRMGVVWWGHGWSPTSRPWRASIRYRLMGLADVVLLYTEDEVRDVSSRGVRGVAFRSLNNTIDLSSVREAMVEWSKGALDKFLARERITGKRILLFCGRLRPNPPTELEVAFRALALLSKSSPDYLLCIVGTGSDEHRLRGLAQELGIDSFVRWVGPIYDENGLAPWFMTASCFVYPGAIGLSLIHAFGYGLPVITHDNRRQHNPEISALRHGENGLTFRRGDERDLCDKIMQICDAPARQRSMSLKALDTVERELSFDDMVARFTEAVQMAARVSLDAAGS